MKGRVLLLEDDEILGRAIASALELEEYGVNWVRSLSQSKQFLGVGTDLYLLDWNLPDGTGLDLCREIRSQDSRTPIIFLTAKSEQSDAVSALKSGANDYVRKPFGLDELFARMERFLNSVRKDANIVLGSLEINTQSRRITYEGLGLDFNRREFDLLFYLVKNADRVVSREEILSALSFDDEVFDRTIDSHISHLRKKLRMAKVNRLKISSVYGVGYRLEVDG